MVNFADYAVSSFSEREQEFISKCPYCPGKPQLAKFGNPLYPYKEDFLPVWICPDCKAYVGCHPKSYRPKGFLANQEFRTLRKKAHALFDPIWKNRQMHRGKAYKRMAEILNILPDHAHISQLSIPQLKKLIRSLELRRQRR